jgi:alanyl-tRNA synthetase
MPTEKLYWTDPHATTFEGAEVRASAWQGRPSLVLDRTLFYPEAGGQLADHGTLSVGDRTFTVEDVQVDDDGVIHHLVAGDAATLDVGGSVRGAIDRDRRRDFMAQHTAQHALSAALMDVARAATESSRLGASLCTIDVDRVAIPDAEVARAEDLVNAIVRDDVKVNALFPNEAELATMKLRRAPKVAGNVRVIEIEGFDLSPCGGTHCTRSGQIGVVRVTGLERYKGKIRVGFHAARRAIDHARAHEAALAALATEFTCGALDVGAAVAKLRAELRSKTDAMAAMRGELVGRIADALWAAHPIDPSGTTVIVAPRANDDVSMLRTLAGKLATRPDVVAIAASIDAESGDLAIVLQKGEKATFDCGAWLKATAAKVGGRGGGRPERAEGRLALKTLEELPALVSR